MILRNYCSIVDETYIVRAQALWKSFQRHCQPYHWHVLVLDEPTLKALCPLENVSIDAYGDWCPVSMPIPEDLRKAREHLDWNVFIWAFKPTWLLYLLQHKKLEHVSYVDADCYFFSSPDALYDEIGDASLAVVPHRFSPMQEHYSANGMYNGGFIYVKDCEHTQCCLQEWSKVCTDHHNGKHTEQKHLNTWPGRWDARVIRHKGVNLAPWNQSRQYTYGIRERKIWVDQYPLVFYHFHQLLDPHYPVESFVQKYVYETYRHVLEGIEGGDI